MVDLHNHLLPGIDDGAPDLDETLRMARTAWADGIRAIVATPHLWWEDRENRWETVRKLSKEVEQFLKEHGVPLRIIPGTEIPTRQETLDLLDEGRLPTMGESRCLLLEPPFAGLPPDMKGFVDRLVGNGYRILLAHPERCRTLQDSPNLIETFLPEGFPIQLTSHSLIGEFGPRPQRAAMELLSIGRPMVIASDSHSFIRRAPVLTQAVEIAATKVGLAYARQMVQDLPSALLSDQPVWPR